MFRTHLPILLGIAAIGALSVFFAGYHKAEIEADITYRTQEALTLVPIRKSAITAEAQTVVLRGLVSSETVRKQAEETARKVRGVNEVRNLLLVDTK